MLRNLSSLCLLVFLLAGCAPAAQPTPASTAVPAATSTPTPPPYDLTVKITDEAGAPVTWAQVALSGLKEATSVTEKGEVVWTNLPNASVTVSVEAQGLSPAEASGELKPGGNEMTIILKSRPFGLTPAVACAPGETPLYAQDFQSGELSDWGIYPPGATFAMQADPAQPDNQVLALNFGKQDGEYQVLATPLEDSVVRRFKYKPGDHSRFNTGWGTGQNGYFMVLSADEFALNQIKDGAVIRSLAHSKPVMEQGIWHLLEISVSGDSIEVWADGQHKFTYAGTAQTEGNVMGIGSAALPPQSIVLIDDLSLCRLNGTFASTYAAN